ncbi:MAG: flagellar biosynthetic protein FliO [Oscillospiraceae bacterium]|nr:flagellar biosynthetic protein FliO [Oscillospiraceae bacterium]MBQ4165178.1 flagellar biosynthetic protein FliO [Oscillospiraceae bacterium]
MEYFQMIMALIGVLALVFLLFWLMKKLNKRVMISDSRNMKILERINLGPDKMLLLVSICGRCMVLGVTSNHTEKICDLEQTEEELTRRDENGNPSFGESFKTVLSGMMGKNKDN